MPSCSETPVRGRTRLRQADHDRPRDHERHADDAADRKLAHLEGEQAESIDRQRRDQLSRDHEAERRGDPEPRRHLDRFAHFWESARDRYGDRRPR